MLHRSLVISGILLLLAVVLFLCRPKLKSKSPWLLLFVGFLSCILYQDSLAVFLQTVALAAILFFSRGSRSKLLFCAEAIGLSIAIYGLLLFWAWLDIRKYQEWREQYAFQSLEDRLPLLPKTGKDVELSPKAKEELSSVSWQINRVDDHHRSMALQNLHRKTMETFVSAPGFGVRRIIAPPTAKNLAVDQDIIIPLPGSLGDLGGRDDDQVASSEDPELETFHRESLLDFVNPRGFGWVKSRAEVAGFQPHFFRKMPKTERWKVRTIELVGLAKSKEPVVYVTGNLPRMEELGKVPTRPLDSFETAGLQILKKGENLSVSQYTGGLRMLGAIRAANNCTSCHGGDEGQLLGAFSYALSQH
jgi:hypothetical protein